MAIGSNYVGSIGDHEWQSEAIRGNHVGTGEPSEAHVRSDDRRGMGGSRGLHNW